MAGTQRKSILQSYIEKNGAEGLNKEYVSKVLGQSSSEGSNAESSSSAMTQNKSILQSYVERNGTEGLNKEYVSRVLGNRIDFGHTGQTNSRVTSIEDANRWFDEAFKLFEYEGCHLACFSH